MMGKELSEMTLEELWDLFPIFLVQHDEWKTEVWDKNIIPDADVLYKKPGYTCEE